MSSNRIEFIVDSYLRPYKKNEVYKEIKNQLISQINAFIKENSEEMSQEDIIKNVNQKLHTNEFDFNLENLTFDSDNKVYFSNKTFKQETLKALLNAEYTKCDFLELITFKESLSFLSLVKCYFKNFSIENSEISKADFLKSDLISSKIVNTRIYNVDFVDCDFIKSSFASSDFRNISFRNCYFKKVSFENTKLINVQFISSSISKVDFTGAIMDHITYDFLNQLNVDLSKVELMSY
ncbi:pentapeptide repeat-containing protein [Salibacterium salarium]|uniref:Pentapeptide repeat-containing protein n=1 Tax=Salibacterium salarium TaxID=284579 RepID=A0A3R9PG10_9BACI|nr:pentapeptide repeat-containing protein [Salibacterium salarium]RSL29932.1 pentapeptide repeat-containing protein [Salibacterium salarium]